MNTKLILECKLNFKRAILRIFSEQSTNTTMIEVKKHGQDEWT